MTAYKPVNDPKTVDEAPEAAAPDDPVPVATIIGPASRPPSWEEINLHQAAIAEKLGDIKRAEFLRGIVATVLPATPGASPDGAAAGHFCKEM